MVRHAWNPGPAIGLAGLALAAPTAHATWSILIVDTRTGEIAVGSATCVTGIDLREETPVIVTGVGAATAQSAVDQTGQNRVFLRDRLLEGLSPDEILDALDGFDGAHQTRQYGIVDAQGRAATFSGAQAADWKGGMTGRIERGRPGPPDDLVYAVQGNILTGAPVVAMAVHAIEITPGDLAERLMAGMEAAAAWGGDGRCSCTSGTPTACGSPPPAPFKSAHCGYMLISRPGDADVCPSIYGLADRPSVIVPVHLDEHPGVDAVVAPLNGSQIALMRSSTAPGDVFPSLADPAFVDTGVSRIRAIGAGDVTGDGVVDLVLSSQVPAQITVLAGAPTPGGITFAVAQTFAVSADPYGLVVGDLDGDFALDVAFVTRSGEELGVALSDGLGSLADPIMIPLAGSPQGMALADLDGDHDHDLAVALNGANAVAILTNDGFGAFTLDQTLATPAGPIGVSAADLDADGETDLAVPCAAGRAVGVFTRDTGAFVRTDLALTHGNGADAALADVNHDGLVDVVAVGVAGFAEPFLNDGAGGWTPAPEVPVGDTGVWTLAIVDLAGDGLPEMLTGGRTQSGVVVLPNDAGTLRGGAGCAAGSYHMELNTGSQGQNKPDPVVTLRAQFDAWADAQLGKPDGVASVVTGRHELVASNESVIEVAVRDRDAQPVTSALTLTADVSNPDAASVVGIDQTGPGRFAVRVRAGVAGETGEVALSVDDGSGGVPLLPAFGVRAVGTLADLNGDGVASMDDLLVFVGWYLGADPRADLNGDGAIDGLDIEVLGNAFLGS